MIVLVPSKVFSSVDVITHGSQRERGTTVNAKRPDSRAVWASLEKPFVWDQPSPVTVLLLPALNSGDWLLEEEPGEIFGTSSCGV